MDARATSPGDEIDRLLTRRVAEVFPSRTEMAKALRSGKKIRIYLGVDPTSPVIHIGHAVPLRKLREFQRLGHRVILLIGDFTGRIGDPSGQTTGRVPLTAEQVRENFATYREQVAKILDFTSPDNPVEVRFNGEWWDQLGARDLIQLAGRFTVQQMIQRDMFQRRLEEGLPIGLHEFLYPLLQGYDSVALDVDAELGGTDQTFNMLAGRTLLKDLRDKEKFVLTTPLLEGTDGRKMSKTLGNTIGIADPPVDMYGRVMSITDDLIVCYLELATDVPEEDIAEVAAQLASGTVNPMDLKKRLAREIVSLYHGPAAAQEAGERFAREVQRREVPAEVPTKSLPREGTWPLADLLVTCELATSRSDARRLIEQGAVQVDGEKIVDPKATVVVRPGMLLRGRRRQYVRLALSSSDS